MPEMTHYASSIKPLGTLLDFFGYSNQKVINIDILKQLTGILGVLSKRGIDEETAVSILKSYEDRNGKLDDSHLRVARFHDFLSEVDKTASDKTPFLDSVKNLGLLSKNELEEYAKETGDWSQFLKRSEADNEQKAQPNEQP